MAWFDWSGEGGTQRTKASLTDSYQQLQRKECSGCSYFVSRQHGAPIFSPERFFRHGFSFVTHAAELLALHGEIQNPASHLLPSFSPSSSVQPRSTCHHGQGGLVSSRVPDTSVGDLQCACTVPARILIGMVSISTDLESPYPHFCISHSLPCYCSARISINW